MQLQRQPLRNGQKLRPSSGDLPTQLKSYPNPALVSSTSNALAAAFSLGNLNFSSHNLKPAKLTLTPHHLYYLLGQFEETGMPIGQMNVRLENIYADASPTNYVSFLNESQRSSRRGDRDSIHSVSSVRSVMSGMSSLWSSFGLGSSTATTKTEKARAQVLTDLTYLYSAFTKIPCLRLSPDGKARLIRGYEEFPFDTAVPLIVFKNLSTLEICDVDFRQFYGWDKLADQLRSLTIKRSNLDDPIDLIVNVVLDDMEKRRRRSCKAQSSPILPRPSSPSLRLNDMGHTHSTTPPIFDDKFSQSASPKHNGPLPAEYERPPARQRPRTKSASPNRPSSSKPDGSYLYTRANSAKIKRSESGSSNSSTQSYRLLRRGSSSNLLTMGFLPASKWRFLRHLSLADNSLTSLTTSSLGPLSNTLHSLDLSFNLFAEVPDCFASLTALRALNLSNCMIESLHSVARSPLPTVNALNLRANRLTSIAGVECLLSLERLDLRDNMIPDPTELARLTGIPDIREIWVLRNPFVKTHSNYRVTIFNLFRGTPGHSEDILIDSSAPGYSERRQLRERVVESDAHPFIKAAPIEPMLNIEPLGGRMSVVGDNVEKKAPRRPSSPRATHSEIAVESGRRRRGPRRRIVDLAQGDSPPVPNKHQVPTQLPPETFQSSVSMTPSNDISPKTELTWLAPPQTYDARSSPEASRSIDPMGNPQPEISDQGRSLATEIKNLNPSGEIYRQKIEALKGEVGNNWLSVLSEDGWHQHRKLQNPSTQINHVERMSPEGSGFRATDQGIMSGARTIG